MENIINILDSFNIEDVNRLLNENINIDINANTINSIMNSVYKKTGIKNQKRKVFLFKKIITYAAIFTIILSSLILVGAAINKLFTFIPGYGIVENNDSIEYILSEPASAENDNVVFTLNNAIANKDNITVMFTLSRKSYTDDQLYKDKQEVLKNQQKNDKSTKAKVYLYAGNIKYTEYGGSTSSGGKTDNSSFAYTLKAEDINTTTTYKLEYENFNISLEFKLKSFNSFDTLEQIGPTEYNNDISITAVPTFVNDKLEVDLYSINKSGYTTCSLFKYNNGYLGKDIHLETNSGIKKYNELDEDFGIDGMLTFDIEPDDKNFTLKIPFIKVQSDEEENISLKIPKEGEKITINKKITFKDCTMTIVDVEKTKPRSIDDYGELKMTFKYDNKTENKIMIKSDFNRANFFGKERGGSWSGEMDENDILTTAYITLEKDDNNSLRLKISNPTYYFIDEYTLSFDR